MSVIEQYHLVCNSIKKYCEKYGVEIEIHDIYALFPDLINNKGLPVKYSWPDDTWPGVDKPGVYIFLDENGKILYVGKATDLGTRLGEYFKHVNYPHNTRCHITYDNWSSKPFYIIIASVSPERPYEISSLEDYLIRILQPTDNSTGK